MNHVKFEINKSNSTPKVARVVSCQIWSWLPSLWGLVTQIGPRNTLDYIVEIFYSENHRLVMLGRPVDGGVDKSQTNWAHFFAQVVDPSEFQGAHLLTKSPVNLEANGMLKFHRINVSKKVHPNHTHSHHTAYITSELRVKSLSLQGAHMTTHSPWSGLQNECLVLGGHQTPRKVHPLDHRNHLPSIWLVFTNQLANGRTCASSLFQLPQYKHHHTHTSIPATNISRELAFSRSDLLILGWFGLMASIAGFSWGTLLETSSTT